MIEHASLDTMMGLRVMVDKYVPDNMIYMLDKITAAMNDMTMASIKTGKSIDTLRLEWEWREHWYRHPEDAWWER